MLSRTLLGLLLRCWIGALALLVAAGCESALSDSLEGLACDAQGNCATGYFCDESHICVRAISDEGAGGAPRTNEPCTAAQCPGACPAGEVICSAGCVDLKTDSRNCGACGRVCDVPSHGRAVCSSSCTVACDAGYRSCADGCVDVGTNASNCGKCGSKCAAGESCISGVCMIACPSGQSRCGDECVDTSHDKKHCGSCDHSCGKDDCIGGACEGGKEESD
jgi:hypothetical protein